MVLVEILKVSLQIGASEIPLVSRVNEKSGRHPNTDVLFGGRNGSSYMTRIIMNDEDPHEHVSLVRMCSHPGTTLGCPPGAFVVMLSSFACPSYAECR
jgi:hypothetical protein